MSDALVLRAEGIVRRHPVRGLRRPAGPPALDGVSVRLAAGERLGLVGRSGSGKSTLLRVLLALDRPTSGSVHLGDRAVAPDSVRRSRWYRRLVQYVPQDPAASLDPRMSVERSILEPLRRLGVAGDHAVRVREVLDAVSLPAALLRARPFDLSGGQAQRVAIARALAPRPVLLLADEPVSGLDMPLRDSVLALLDDVSRREALGILLVSHDLDAVARLCPRTVVLDAGRVVEDRPTEAVLAEPHSIAARALVAALPRLRTGGER